MTKMRNGQKTRNYLKFRLPKVNFLTTEFNK